MSHRSREEDLRMAGKSCWPAISRYFLARIMDASTATKLIRGNTKFNDHKNVPRLLHYIDLTSDGVFPLSINIGEQESLATLKLSAMQPDSSRIVFVDQQRRYYDNSTHVYINTTRNEWLDILDTCMIPPPALELVYDNNGGSFQHLSYCNDNPKAPCTAVFPNSAPSAHHICFKLCVWHFEHFVYARYDFHARGAFVMVAGVSNGEQLRKVVTQFHGQRNIGLFDILLALICQWAQEVEEMRWLSDFATQTYESQTGVSSLAHLTRTRVPPEKLRLRTEIVSTQDTLRAIARASDHVGELFEFLQNSLWRFHGVCTEHTGILTSKRYYQQLYDTIEMRISQQRSQAAQIGILKLRVTSQWDVVNASLSHYNNNLTVDMARDSRADSVLLRRIAIITMIFLPAIFLATFFSMSFFQVSDSGLDLKVSRWIWLYVVCTIPFTALLAWQYTP